MEGVQTMSRGHSSKKWLCAGLRMACVGGLAMMGLPVWAAENFTVGVMNQQTIIEKSKTGQKALDELKAFSAARQKIISSDEEELKELETASQDSKLKEEDRRAKENLFRAKLEAYQRRLQDFNREIQDKQKGMVESYSKRIEQAAQLVAQRRGYVAVIDSGTEGNLRITLYYHKSLDLTDDIIKEFDAQSKTP